MQTLELKHRLATRWTHWVNFPVLSLMIMSGMWIYWAWDPFTTPDWVYRMSGIGKKLAFGMAIHFVFAWLFAINGFVYAIYTLISGEWRELLPDAKCFTEALEVVKHDLGLGPLPPQGRYNAAQRITYTLIILMGFGSLLTGLAIYKPIQLAWLTGLLGGYQWARFEHFWLTVGYVGFFGIHIGQVIRAGWANFRSMVCGYDLPTDLTNKGEANAQ